ncbi:MAG TPA: PDZ domain-containing protein [Bacteroidia bacterium]|nr:PDZ domain-containing protein [Bacteroidia bacterium]
MKNIILAGIIVLLSLTLLKAQSAESRLLRFPAVSENSVVFSYAGDLYSVARSGGIARKITSDVGYEIFPRFSPDGSTIAFAGQYDGNSEVYSMPANGGIPHRLTYTATLSRDDISDRMGPNNIVMTWRDDKSVVYRSRKKSFNDFKGQLFVASTGGGLSEELPFSVGGFCSYSPDKKRIAMNRVFREFRTWKYYKGGMADEVWIFDFDTKNWENISNNNAQDLFPMWYGDKIYYASDRDRTMNLFEYDLKTKQTKKITEFTEFDVKFPSLGNDAIAYENGGYIYLYDLKTGTNAKVPVTINDDMDNGRNSWVDASKFINTKDIGSDGNRLVFTARGDVWTVPVKSGISRNLSKSNASHERDAIWSPDGKSIAYISDANGETEIYTIKQEGLEPAKQITKNSDTYIYSPAWSPNSKMILWSDNKLRLTYVNVETGEQVLVDKNNVGEYSSYEFSPDSRWIAYSKPDDDRRYKIYLYNLADKKSYPVTDAWYESAGPNFSDDGKYLFFYSNRDFNPVYSATEWNHSYGDMSKVYFVTLAKSTANPLEPKNDEVKIEEVKAPSDDKGDNADKKKDNKKVDASGKAITIDIDGIQNRIVSLPIGAGSYYSVRCIGNSVYYMFNSSKSEKASLKLFDLKEKKETDLGNVDGFGLSADNKKMYVIKDKNNYVIDLPKSKPELTNPVDLSNMKVFIDKKTEWKQIFEESWRQMRDFFWDPTMSGVDWAGMKKKYEVLLPYVNHRNDLTYVIGEMIGELNTGHAYTGGGDKPSFNKISMGLLGAELTRHSSGYYSITKILKGENWNNKNRSPLTEIGVDAKVGDFIVAVNGVSTKGMNDIYESLINTADKQVELSLNSKADETGARKVLVLPISSESSLYYYNWVQHNIKIVSDATNNEVGYLHIPNMGVEGLNEFSKHFYPQLKKKALIIDDRGNGGGNVSPMIIERLNREIAMVGIGRNRSTNPNPDDMLLGPKIVMIDQYSASDGDIFPYRFKKYNMGKVIGQRSWGGVVGIRGSLPFVDGGYLNKPEFSRYDLEGKEWIMEGHGVDPDIVVVQDPYLEYMGTDLQLLRAIEEIKIDLKSQGKELPPMPPYPKKNK